MAGCQREPRLRRGNGLRVARALVQQQREVHEAARVLRGDARRLDEQPLRFHGIAVLGEQQAQVRQRGGVARIGGQHLPVERGRLRDAPRLVRAGGGLEDLLGRSEHGGG